MKNVKFENHHREQKWPNFAGTVGTGNVYLAGVQNCCRSVTLYVSQSLYF